MGATPFERMPSPILDTNGNLAPGALAYFTVAVDTPLTVYQDSDLSTPHEHPVPADGTGRLPYIFLPYGDYNVRLTTAAGATIFSATGCANPEPPDAGGGGGIVVTASEIFATGFPMPLFQSVPPTAWVLMDGNTIGNAASSATNRANSDTEDLFAYLWENLANAEAAVSGGRGASASADYAANKAIVVPTMASIIAGGVGSGLSTTLGALVGDATRTLLATNLPSFTTGSNSSDHSHSYDYPNNQTSFAYTSGPTSTPSLLVPGLTASNNTGGQNVTHTHTFTGSSTPFGIVQPTRAFNWFMKL